MALGKYHVFESLDPLGFGCGEVESSGRNGCGWDPKVGPRPFEGI